MLTIWRVPADCRPFDSANMCGVALRPFESGSSSMRVTRGLTAEVSPRYLLRMHPSEVRALRKRLGLTQVKFAELLGVSALTVKRWEAGTQAMREPIDRLIRLLTDKQPPRKHKGKGR